jgi:hypothetical protein
MAMIKNGNPTLERASLFYKNHQLYPFKELIGGYDDFNHFEDGSYLVITEKDENIPLNQNLIKSQDHHNTIIQFIKIMSDIKEDDKDDSSPLPRRALHAAYNFLTVLVWNHNENKKELEDLLRISECHLKFNVGNGAGYLVLKLFLGGNEPKLHLLDLVLKEKDIDSAEEVLNFVFLTANNLGASSVTCWLPLGHKYERYFVRSGFSMTGSLSRSVFVRCNGGQDDLLIKEGPWHLSQGDSDVF